MYQFLSYWTKGQQFLMWPDGGFSKKKMAKIVWAFCCDAFAQIYIFKLDRVGVKSTNHVNLTQSFTSDPGAWMMCFYIILALFPCVYIVHTSRPCSLNVHWQKNIFSLLQVLWLDDLKYNSQTTEMFKQVHLMLN